MKRINFELAKITVVFTFLAATLAAFIIFISRLIIYIRATQQQCIPDVTFVEFTYMIQLAIMIPLVTFGVYGVAFILLWLDSFTYPKINVGSVAKPFIFVGDKFNVLLNRVNSKWFDVFIHIWFIGYLLIVLIFIVLSIYKLFFGDPCVFVE